MSESLEAISSRIALLSEINKTLSESGARDKLKIMKAIVKELYKRLKKEELFLALRTRQERSNSSESVASSPFRQSISPFELAESSESVDLDRYSSGQEGENFFDSEGPFWMDMKEIVSNGSLKTASE